MSRPTSRAGTASSSAGTGPHVPAELTARPVATRIAVDDDDRARRLLAARRWHRRAELAARRAARASSAVR